MFLADNAVDISQLLSKTVESLELESLILVVRLNTLRNRYHSHKRYQMIGPEESFYKFLDFGFRIYLEIVI